MRHENMANPASDAAGFYNTLYSGRNFLELYLQVRLYVKFMYHIFPKFPILYMVHPATKSGNLSSFIYRHSRPDRESSVFPFPVSHFLKEPVPYLIREGLRGFLALSFFPRFASGEEPRDVVGSLLSPFPPL